MLWERKGNFALNNEGGIQVVGIRYMQTNTIGTCFIGITAIYPFSGLDIFQMYAKIKKQIKSRVNWYSKYDIMCEPDFWITRYWTSLFSFPVKQAFCRYFSLVFRSLRRRHNEWGGVWNHQPQDCLLNRLSRRRSKKTSKPRVTGLCAGNSPGTGEFPTQMVSNAEMVSIWWLHHVSLWFIINSTACHINFCLRGLVHSGRNNT